MRLQTDCGSLGLCESDVGLLTCATACTIRLGPLPRYVLAPMNTAPSEMAASSFATQPGARAVCSAPAQY